MQRRTFLTSAAAALPRQNSPERRPNILWITCEDLSPILGCYGDTYAATPNLDKFAERSTRYDLAYATAPVCTPSRSCLITGRYATSLGSMHLRGSIEKPSDVPCFPELLRAAGYYTSNNVKEDYNFERPKDCWDESSDRAHWRARAKGQPFFSVFNIMATHQGQIRYDAAELARRNAALPAALRHDPARAPLPPYYPDTPAVRGQIAALYTQVTLMDQRVGQILRELEQDGLASETIVFFYSDHGTGLRRGKRFLHDTGLRVPLMVHMPGQDKSAITSRLVSFVDFAATALSLAGVRPPSSSQGSAFLGPYAAKPREIAFAARDRVDEEIETSRTAFDGRWQYIRNYTPHRPVLQHGEYSEVAAVWIELRRLHAEGKLAGPAASLLAATKPPEELYDLQSDPWQLRNLAGQRAFDSHRDRLRRAMHAWMLDTRDRGLIPEPEMRAGASCSIPAALEAAEGRPNFESADPAVQYWSAVALLNGKYSPAAAAKLARHGNPSARIAAAEALCRHGETREGLPVLTEALDSPDSCLRLAAAASLYHLGSAARGALPALRAALSTPSEPAQQRVYFDSVVKKLLAP